MNFIRTTDARGRPLKQPKPKPEPMTEKQNRALNEYLRKADASRLTTAQTLRGIRDVMDRHKVSPQMKEKVLTDFARSAYLDHKQDFTGKHAAAALNILLGKDRADADKTVSTWGQDADDGTGEADGE